MKKSGLLLLLIAFSTAVFPQGESDFINGVLLDANTKEPVVFANIRIKDRDVGIITNVDGSFRLPLKYQEYGNIIEISSMGYETKELSIAYFRQDELNTLTINPMAIDLQEVVVNAKGRLAKVKADENLSAKQIIRFAIERIPNNYDKNPFKLVGYYRDYQLREKEFINLNEALVKVFDPGFEVKDYSSLQFSLYNYKANLNFDKDTLAAKPYDYHNKDKYIPNTKFTNSVVPNELVLLFNHDAIRHNDELSYSFVDIFVKDFIRNHDFYTYFLTNYGDKKVYKIKFEKNLTRFQVKGDIYIDVGTYAIRKLDYAVYEQRLDQVSATNYSESDMELLYQILVEYKEKTGYMYLNYISFQNKFKLVRPPKFYIKDFIRKSDTQELLVVLNKPAKNWYSLKPKDFHIYYGESRLKVDGLSQKDNAIYKIDFARSTKPQRKSRREFFRELGSKREKPIILQISNMIDFDNNKLGEENSELLIQFREYFTQKIIPLENNQAGNTSYVNKTISLDHPDQINTKMKDDEEFWMNTPMKKVSQ